MSPLQRRSNRRTRRIINAAPLLQVDFRGLSEEAQDFVLAAETLLASDIAPLERVLIRQYVTMLLNEKPVDGIEELTGEVAIRHGLRLWCGSRVYQRCRARTKA
jgi:hypothetical protein